MSLGALSLDKALLHEQSREQARHDSLTGLLGHRVFHEVLEQQIAAASPFSVLLFDIDDFKQINDLHGHQTGDHALRLVAEALRQGTRSGDSVFRIGGEEFCALLPGLTEQDAFAVAEGVRQKVAAILSTLPNPVTVSVGVASFPAHGQRRDELLSDRRRRAVRLQAGREEPHQRRRRRGRRGTSRPSRREVGLDLLHQKDPDTVSHSVHVAILTVEIARALGARRRPARRPAGRPRGCTTSASSPCRTPSSTRPGALDEDEFRIIKTHPVVGAELLRSWGLAGPATIVLQHHERIDGSGYPTGLRGDEIRLESRIVHAADAYVAMMRDRPYRKAMRQEEAFAELVRHSGTQFDRDVVAALVAIELARPARSSARRDPHRAARRRGRPAARRLTLRPPAAHLSWWHGRSGLEVRAGGSGSRTFRAATSPRGSARRST